MIAFRSNEVTLVSVQRIGFQFVFAANYASDFVRAELSPRPPMTRLIQFAAGLHRPTEFLFRQEPSGQEWQ